MKTRKRVYRTRKPDKIIGGVFGGLGEYFNIDPLFLRLLFVVLFLLTPASPVIFIAYIVTWILTPFKCIEISES